MKNLSLQEYKDYLKKKGKGKNRYGNRKNADKPKEDGYMFDSNPELHRYRYLKKLLLVGEIKDLEVKPIFILAEKTINAHGQKISAWKYEADFGYVTVKDGVYCVEDVKSLRIDKKKKKYGTATERSYKLSRNELMRQNRHIRFVETVY